MIPEFKQPLTNRIQRCTAKAKNQSRVEEAGVAAIIACGLV